MTSITNRPLTGRNVAAIMCACFAIIISVNLTLAYQAVRTFPGLEVKNSYVASQSFDVDRAAQLALDWDVSAEVRAGILRLEISNDGQPVSPEIRSVVFGMATSVAADKFPELRFDGTAFVAPIDVQAGNWNLRVVAEAADGTVFRQRIIVRVVQ
ncbi:MAG: nitrogen fixation protein FixH [Gammaproteobacteria bacterium]|jgi:nitrogen fixation protein FixH